MSSVVDQRSAGGLIEATLSSPLSGRAGRRGRGPSDCQPLNVAVYLAVVCPISSINRRIVCSSRSL